MEKISDNIINSDLTKLAVQEKQKSLEKTVENLRNTITNDLKKENDTLRKNVLIQLLDYLHNTEDSYNAIYFLYNFGKFRTMEEIDSYNRSIDYAKQQEEIKRERERFEKQKEYDKKYFSSGQYERECGKPIYCWLPFIINVIAFAICILSINLEGFLITFTLSPITLGISALLRSGYSKRCIRLADEHSTYKNYSTKYHKEVDNVNAMRLSGIVTAMSCYHSINKSVKSLSNPDSWNVLK